MIQTEDLTKWFGTFSAVEGVHLNVSSGQVLALLGPNGAGKTTTVRMLTSILKPTRGRAVVAGYDVAARPDIVRRRVGVLTEHHGLYGRMNALEYLGYFADLYSIDLVGRNKAIQALLEQFGLAADQYRRLSEFSKGMRQKLALVRAMLHDPPVLLLDEPTSAMDPESARIVRNSIRGLRSADRTILLCTHNLAEAEELADQVAIIRRGRIIFNETLPAIKSKLLGEPEYEAVFAGSVNSLQGLRLSDAVKVITYGENWVRFQIQQPEVNNPRLLKTLLEGGLAVVTLREVPRSLEDAYMEAVNNEVNNGSHPG